jgi:pyruvate formate lyase activating enzyme
MTGPAVPTKYWRLRPDGRIQCDLCPRRCRLREGRRGLCFVRACRESQVVLTAYGRSSGFSVDPVEKKPLYHFLPGTPVFSFGTAGCNLTCRFCQNWAISRAQAIAVAADVAPPEQIARAAVALGCRSVAFTYNEPVIFHEYAIDVAAACRERGIRTVAVTAGYVCPEPRAEFYRHMDAANVDLKAFSDVFYRRMCAGQLQPVLDTLVYLKRETDVWFEITNLVIPGENDSPAEIDAMTRWVVGELGPDVPIHFTAFRPDWRLRDRPPTPAATLRRAREIAQGNGVRHAYTGNIRDPAGNSTCCPACDALLIGRRGHELAEWNLTPAGACRSCGVPCAGVFEVGPGNWGARYLPVRPGACGKEPAT